MQTTQVEENKSNGISDDEIIGALALQHCKDVYRYTGWEIESGDEDASVANRKYGFIAGYKADKWISVEDRLPELKKVWDAQDECYKQEAVITVIVYDSVEDSVYAASYSGNGNFDMYNKDITHWQPLPEPPVK